MSRYIDADALKENCYKQMDELMESTSEHLSAEALSLLCGFTLIDSAPSIDIVHCGECTERDDDWCMYFGKMINPDDFCSYGEREGEPQTCEECEHWNDTEDGCADRHGCKTENSSEKPNNCEWSVEYAKEMLNTMPCEECGHWEHGAGDHYYCALLEMRQECCFESKGESTLMFANIPQTERSE